MKRRIMSLVLSAIFFPAYAANVALKTAVRLPFMPMMWMIKLIYPNIVDDIGNKSKQIKSSVRNKADESFMSLSSLMAK